MMKQVFVLFAIALSLSACQSATYGNQGNGGSAVPPAYNNPAQNSKVINKIFTILEVKGDKDGDSVVLRDRNGVIYRAVLSIPNLGMHSTYDHSQTKVGAHIRADGEIFRLGNNLHIHITRAVNVRFN